VRIGLTILMLSLAACSTPRSSADLTRAPSDWVGEGLIIDVGQELHLFKDPSNLQFPGGCTTITAKTSDAFKRFQSLDHKMVVVRGHAIEWPSTAHSISLDKKHWVMNTCNSANVVIASEITPR
jgi:hypothetical protein